MVYSILLPAFPTARQEVYSDNGYVGMRSDIYLDMYNLIIGQSKPARPQILAVEGNGKVC